MSFRKDSILFSEGYVIYALMIITNLFCFYITQIEVFLLLIIPFIILTIFNAKRFSEIITIDKSGIICRTTEEIKWKYAWEDIAELQRFTRFRNPSIEIVVYMTHEPEKKQLSGNYFQLSKKAKKALKTYYDKPIQKFKQQ